MVRSLFRPGVAVGVFVAGASVVAALPSVVEVDQRGQRFTVAEVSVARGGTVLFHNSDDVIHNIMAIDAEEVPEDYGLQQPGETLRVEFHRRGAFQVRCSIHPRMKMTVRVGDGAGAAP